MGDKGRKKKTPGEDQGNDGAPRGNQPQQQQQPVQGGQQPAGPWGGQRSGPPGPQPVAQQAPAGAWGAQRGGPPGPQQAAGPGGPPGFQQPAGPGGPPGFQQPAGRGCPPGFQQPAGRDGPLGRQQGPGRDDRQSAPQGGRRGGSPGRQQGPGRDDRQSAPQGGRRGGSPGRQQGPGRDDRQSAPQGGRRGGSPGRQQGPGRDDRQSAPQGGRRGGSPGRQQGPGRDDRQSAPQGGRRGGSPGRQQGPGRDDRQSAPQGGQRGGSPGRQQGPRRDDRQSAPQGGQRSGSPGRQQGPGRDGRQSAPQGGRRGGSPGRQQGPGRDDRQSAPQGGRRGGSPGRQQGPGRDDRQSAPQGGRRGGSPGRQQGPGRDDRQSAPQGGRRGGSPGRQQGPGRDDRQSAPQGGRRGGSPGRQQGPGRDDRQSAPQGGRRGGSPGRQQGPGRDDRQSAPQGGQRGGSPGRQQGPRRDDRQSAPQGGQRSGSPGRQQGPGRDGRQSAPQQQAGGRGNQQNPRKDFPQGAQPSPSKSVESIGASLTKISIDGFEKKTLSKHEQNRLLSIIPSRKVPGRAGTAGRKITVRTNMLSIIFSNKFKTEAIHYDVKFDPDKPKFLKRLAFNELRKQKFANKWPAFDGRANAYSAGDLPFGNQLEAEVEVFDEERQQNRQVKVTMMKVNSIDLSWLKDVKPGLKEHEKDQMTMQVLDVILRCATFERGTLVGRSCFQRPPQPLDLGSGMELWSGLFHSAVLGWKPYINVDVANKAFPKPQPVISAIQDLCSSFREKCNNVTPAIIERNYDKINSYLKGLKVVYQLPNQPTTRRTMGVNGLAKSARTATFAMDNNEVTTVEKYFAGAKKYRIQFPELPCLWVGPRQKVPNILVPLELCTIASGLINNRKLDENQTRGMIRETAVPPASREKKIKDAYQSYDFNSNKTMNEFGISITGEFATVAARVLSPPGLMDTREIRVNKGVWRPNHFYKAGELSPGTWTILNLSDVQDRGLYSFVETLKTNENGMTIQDPHTPFEKFRVSHNVLPTLIKYFESMKQRGIKLVVVVIPGRFADAYPKVKQVAELKVGILTQCIKDNTINKMDRSTAGNILLKINSKLNGVNHTFHAAAKPPCLKTPCMLFGADVTHPSPDATDIPSIAAVASSFEPTAFKYNVTIRLQPPRQEIIIHLEEIVYDQIKGFTEKNKVRPAKIIFYRDGVSEGQFPQVMHYELQAIRNACRRFGAPDKYEPKITFLVVQKRHHIRLFPTDRKNSDDRAGNVQAGTVVDTEITHPSHIDFYLVSHASIQGTARPTKYRCLWDDNDMSEDEIEQLTYYLCHMFSRCTRSVSYPAPTYYAHLAAFRARALINNVPIQINNLDQEQRTKLTLRDEIVRNSPMFFV